MVSRQYANTVRTMYNCAQWVQRQKIKEIKAFQLAVSTICSSCWLFVISASLTGYEGESDSDNLPPSPQPKGLRRRAAVRPPKSAVPVRKRQRRCLSQSPPVAPVAPAPSQPDNKENEVWYTTKTRENIYELRTRFFFDRNSSHHKI